MELNNVTLRLSNARELISINGDLTNFHSSFNITSANKEPFRALIVSQTILDSLDEDGTLEMKNVEKGVFAGSLTENLGNKETWYIALEADKEVSVQVNVHTEEIDQFVASDEDEGATKKRGFPIWLILLIVAILILIGYFVWRHFFCATPKIALPSPQITRTPVVTPITEPVIAVVEPPLDMDFSDLPEV